MREPPHNLEAERKMLGGCILDNDMIDVAVEILAPSDFYRAAHMEVWGAIVDLRDNGTPVDPQILADELMRRGQFERLGGDQLLGDLLESTPHGVNVAYHAKIVRHTSMIRAAIQASAETIEECYAYQDTAESLVSKAEERIYAISERKVANSIQDAGQLMGVTMTEIQSRMQGGLIDGVLTGFTDLDEMLCGLKQSQLIIVAGRPSMGKTAFAMGICQNASVLVSTLFVSLEMNAGELGERLLSSVARVDSYKLKKTGLLSTREMNDLAKAGDHISKLRLKIDDSAERTVSEIAAAARRIKSRGSLDLIVIDYLSLINPQHRKGESRQDEVARISRRLKAMARELKLPVIALQQLNREAEKRESSGHRPRMADLRESGAIEQDADVILLLHRPEYYDPNDQPGIAEVIVAKNRNGATGTEKLVFTKNCTRFDSISHEVMRYGNGGF